MTTKQLNIAQAKDIACHVHPATDLSQLAEKGPHIFHRGEGIYVFDDKGKRYIEGLSGLWCASLGFSEKRLVDAARRQMELLPFYHNFASKAVQPTIDLAALLIERAPVPMSKVLFTNSGSEANDTQVKLVWYYNNILGRPSKKKIIARRGAYHGITVASGSMTGLPASHWGFDLPIDRFLHTDCPHYYRLGQEGETEEQFSSRLAANLEELIVKEGPDTVAAFIAEPFLGAGGVIPAPRGYFEKIQPILERYDILFTSATENYSLKPDLITLAKALSAAYQPIGAVMMTERIYETLLEGSRKYGIFGTGFTYSGHPVPAAVALETQRIYDTDRIGEHVNAISPQFQKRLRALAEHPLVGDARGVSLIGAVELVKNKQTKQSFDASLKLGAWVVSKATEHGLILRALANDTVAMCPPLIINEAQIDEMFDSLGLALDEAHHNFAGQ
jgi:4-aminobutyrate--pyruvate transaminase